ncbi:unnamed protein product, partial [Meganyctiphanes norvegica]
VTELEKVYFTGTRKLLEYQVLDITETAELYQNRSSQRVMIVLQNMYGYYISSTYVPTLLLVIISYLCFFFNIEDFTNRVMVCLTSMLVLAGLFAQVAAGLPRTSYLKLIDLWFIFCIITEFVMVSLLVLINSLKYMDQKNIRTVQ